VFSFHISIIRKNISFFNYDKRKFFILLLRSEFFLEYSLFSKQLSLEKDKYLIVAKSMPNKKTNYPLKISIDSPNSLFFLFVFSFFNLKGISSYSNQLSLDLLYIQLLI